MGQTQHDQPFLAQLLPLPTWIFLIMKKLEWTHGPPIHPWHCKSHSSIGGLVEVAKIHKNPDIFWGLPCPCFTNEDGLGWFQWCTYKVGRDLDGFGTSDGPLFGDSPPVGLHWLNGNMIICGICGTLTMLDWIFMSCFFDQHVVENWHSWPCSRVVEAGRFPAMLQSKLQRLVLKWDIQNHLFIRKSWMESSVKKC